ncbi:TetR/AcrR family transcriptional regulator [Streptomyces sp. NPDC001380]|uniref:TetR/AcrR family transcriptional regulator n=1 Tax=Streptomyces sp. NPDC001380 TaxID=3364566 RepID=UPI003684C552
MHADAGPAAGPGHAGAAGHDTGQGAGRPRRLPVEQRREQLIAVALELFSTRPPEEVSLDEVAEAAAASRPLVYRYFAGGKQQLYEAALRSAAQELVRRFVEPVDGTPTERLAQGLDRYFGFVAGHAAGYGALLRGGSVVETERTSAIVDDVRRAAFRHVMGNLEVDGPGPRLALLVRSWISVVEASALTWLDEGRLIPQGELRDWLVDQFAAMLAVTALHDAEAARTLAAVLERESAGGPADRLAGVLGAGGLPLRGAARSALPDGSPDPAAAAV